MAKSASKKALQNTALVFVSVFVTLGIVELGLRLAGFDLNYTAKVFPFNDVCNNTVRMAETCSLQHYHRPYMVVDGNDLRVTFLSETRTRWIKDLVLFGLLENATSLARKADPGGRAGSGDVREAR
jgi:hypothetical protein